jgi:hypothetical protein
MPQVRQGGNRPCSEHDGVGGSLLLQEMRVSEGETRRLSRWWVQLGVRETPRSGVQQGRLGRNRQDLGRIMNAPV